VLQVPKVIILVQVLQVLRELKVLKEPQDRRA
jgi:hypothetical protein